MIDEQTSYGSFSCIIEKEDKQSFIMSVATYGTINAPNGLVINGPSVSVPNSFAAFTATTSSSTPMVSDGTSATNITAYVALGATSFANSTQTHNVRIIKISQAPGLVSEFFCARIEIPFNCMQKSKDFTNGLTNIYVNLYYSSCGREFFLNIKIDDAAVIMFYLIFNSIAETSIEILENHIN